MGGEREAIREGELSVGGEGFLEEGERRSRSGSVAHLWCFIIIL